MFYESDARKAKISCAVFGDVFWQAANSTEKLCNRSNVRLVQVGVKGGNWHYCKKDWG